MAALQLYQQWLADAWVNLAPMAEEAVLGLDAQWVRLALETEGFPRDEWADLIAKLRIVHRAAVEVMNFKRG